MIIDRRDFERFLEGNPGHIFSTSEIGACPLAQYLQYTLDDPDVTVSTKDYTTGTGQSFPLPAWACAFSASDEIGTGTAMAALLRTIDAEVTE